MEERFKVFVFMRILLLVLCGLRFSAAQTCSITLPTLSNGVLISGNTGGPYFDGHVINYMCSNSFATSNDQISCTCDVTTDPNNPAWSCSSMFTTTVCRRICVNRPTAPANSQTNPTVISEQFLAGDAIEYSCDGDLTSGEPTTITCQDMGPPMAVWSTTLIPDCTCYINSLPQITVGPNITITGPLAPNSPVNYSCSDSDFFINGAQTNQCNETGAYAETAPSCERACSTALPTLTNGMVISGNTGSPYFDGHVIDYMCSDSFATSDGPINCTCDVKTDPNNSSWSCSPMFTTSVCRRNCDASPPMNTNGAVSSSNTAVSLSRLIPLNAYIMMIFHALT